MNNMERVFSKIDTSTLDDIIVGRLEPYIYAFSTECVPNYLKVGDTARGVSVRLGEWKTIFQDLVLRYEHSAQIDDNTIFRDLNVHQFLMHERGRIRLQPNTFDNLPYFSREFFKDTTPKDVDDAVTDIIKSAQEKSGKYKLYSPDRLPKKTNYERNENYSLRDNQRQVVDNFKRAVSAGRTKLLLYAVMRFGKTFTSMCCAKEIGARFVVIVSAKVDVSEEWKKQVQSHVDFVDYEYLNSKSLKQSETIIADTLANPDKKVALFLTLQDLQGKFIKNKHEEVFNRRIDLLIIDETHFGARGASYGEVLREHKLSKAQIKEELKSLDGFETLDRIEDAVKILNARIQLHLSGTPYRILMSEEFTKEDIIAVIQFTDIIDAQRQWDDVHRNDDGYEEWENPYFGFPQMIRFAFNPNESSRRTMEQMRKNGITYAFSELFRPLSMTPQADDRHCQFKHEAEILDLLEVIDGTKEDENLLGFLDYDKIKDGKMCRHIVCVLPFRASCDAMSALIKKNKDRFKNLWDYKIINIAGFDEESKYKSVGDVKRTIREYENNNCKTLTLTVNRMMTGATVPQWDTMLYLKGTASPQEYDQAIFRLQNQYIKTFKDKNGKLFKYNMKPQTLLVDFDPNRMFVLQELKSQCYNFNSMVRGNNQLKERIAKELKVSPIIVLNKNKLQQATPTNITDAVRAYSRTRSILDEALEIPADGMLMSDANLLRIIQGIAPINAKKGLQINPTEGEGDGFNPPNGGADAPNKGTDKNDAPSANLQRPTNQEDNDNKIEKRLAAYYARILFFAFLTESVVKSLEDVIAQIPVTEDNRRIARHLGLNLDILKLVQRKINSSVLLRLDYKIENSNDLIRDDVLQSIERVEVALRKFGRMSDSEIVTPANVADEMVSILPFDELNTNKKIKFLDIASKQGEFAIALYKKFGEKVKDKIYSIPTSKLAYEFTRKTYKLLGMPIENIYDDFTSYDLIGKNNQEIIKRLKDMNFAAIIGNPPYQEVGLNNNKAEAIYPYFYDIAERISGINALISPARFLFNAGLTPKVWNQKMLSDEHICVVRYFHDSSDVFPNTNINGGVAVILRNSSVKYSPIGMFVPNDTLRSIAEKFKGEGHTSLSSIVYGGRSDLKFNDKFLSDFPDTPQRILRLLQAEHPEIKTLGPNEEYELKSSSFTRTPYAFSDVQPESESEYYKILGIEKGQRIFKWVRREHMSPRYPDNNNIETFKVLLSNADGAAGQIGKPIPARIIGKPVVAAPGTSAFPTFMGIGNFSTEVEAINLSKYIQSKFVRVLIGVLKVTQHITPSTWDFVPMQDFTENSDIDWSKSVAEIDAQLYAKYGLSDEEIAFIESMIKPM